MKIIPSRRRASIACIALLASSLLGSGAAPSPAQAGGPPFTDIGGSPFIDEIGWLWHVGITQGCNPPDYDRFCPTDTVSRQQMASFLARALELPTTTNDYFTDDTGSPHEPDINRLRLANITNGCDPANNRFCPGGVVSRQEMASFIARALELPTTSTDYFTDDTGSPHEADINRMRAAGITNGCNPPDLDRYCPGSPVLREQMAAFLQRALDRPCDIGLTSNSPDPVAAARALGLCYVSGLEAAAWMLPDGGAIPAATVAFHSGHAIRQGFGTVIAPQEGTGMLVLSTGTAADTNDTNPGYAADTDKGYSHALPSGFPLTEERYPEGGACPDRLATASDGVALELTLTAPPGADALSVDWTYLTHDYPDWVCTHFVDVAAVLVDGTNVMEIEGLTVSANTAMEYCTNGATGGGGVDPPDGNHTTCISTAPLAGTGFDSPAGGASAWHTTTVPVTPGETYIIVLAIWDTADGIIKSTALFDNFQWLE